MRVEAYNSVAQIYKTNRAAGASAAAKTEKSRDQVEISSIGYDYQIAKQAVAEASDIREDKVAELSAEGEIRHLRCEQRGFCREASGEISLPLCCKIREMRADCG